MLIGFYRTGFKPDIKNIPIHEMHALPIAVSYSRQLFAQAYGPNVEYALSALTVRWMGIKSTLFFDELAIKRHMLRNEEATKILRTIGREVYPQLNPDDFDCILGPALLMGFSMPEVKEYIV